MQIAFCTHCARIIVLDKKTPLPEWLAELGAKETGEFIHGACLQEQHPSWFDFTD